MGLESRTPVSKPTPMLSLPRSLCSLDTTAFPKRVCFSPSEITSALGHESSPVQSTQERLLKDNDYCFNILSPLYCRTFFKLSRLPCKVSRRDLGKEATGIE